MYSTGNWSTVSILVFLEFRLGVLSSSQRTYSGVVSILVFLEFRLGEKGLTNSDIANYSFNPCFSGISSGSAKNEIAYRAGLSFNPCFSGISSGRRQRKQGRLTLLRVSILVFLEFRLGGCAHWSGNYG